MSVNSRLTKIIGQRNRKDLSWPHFDDEGQMLLANQDSL